MKKHLIFDLDGTLIDSAPSILASFAHAFESKGMPTQVPLTPEVIGPPLMQTLTKLTGVDDVEVLTDLAARFKSHYDTVGHKQTVVYAGVESLLQALIAAGYALYIATNKRHFPTVNIMQHLAWGDYFTGVFALDYYAPPLANKGQMLARVLADVNIAPSEAWYIGDRYEDGVAAAQNSLPFLLVNWGYFDENVAQAKPEWPSFSTVAALQAFLIGQ